MSEKGPSKFETGPDKKPEKTPSKQTDGRVTGPLGSLATKNATKK
jgi:hypothetical protein